MRIVFAGTPDFSVPTLEALYQSQHEVIAVYTQPDRPAGRGRKIQVSPVKAFALAHDLPIFQPNSLKNIDSAIELRTLEPDVMVVIAYGLILPVSILDIPKFGCINVHASLLPRHRGASPIQHAILVGDELTGITTMLMDQGLDTGAMLEKQTCAIEATDDASLLHDKLAMLGASTLIKTLQKLENHTLVATPQDENLATYAPKINKADGLIDWQQDAATIVRKVRAFHPWPIAYTAIQNLTLRVYAAECFSDSVNAAPGTLIDANEHGIDVAAGSGIVRIQKLQFPGGKAMQVKASLNAKAHLFTKGSRFGE